MVRVEDLTKENSWAEYRILVGELRRSQLHCPMRLSLVPIQILCGCQDVVVDNRTLRGDEKIYSWPDSESQTGGSSVSLRER